MLKILFLQGMSGDIVFRINDEVDFENEEAIRLIDAGIAEPTNKKAYKEVLKKIKEKESKDKEKEEKASALLHKEELETERIKLQIRVDDITNSLGDGSEYYKSYLGFTSTEKKLDELVYDKDFNLNKDKGEGK